jgi:hypothetical protein
MTYTSGQINSSQADGNDRLVILQVLPIIIDLNHDGALSYGHVVMDVNGDGQLDATGWAGAQDGVLVWDKYHDGQVHDHSQYAFAQYDTTAAAQGRTATDLSGLAARFDTNHDGVFDAQDEQFVDFTVWQDANQNGVSDADEVKTLAELGLASFNPPSDGVARAPETGVNEAGQTSALTADGTQVLVADVGFDYTTLDRAGGADTFRWLGGSAPSTTGMVDTTADLFKGDDKLDLWNMLNDSVNAISRPTENFNLRNFGNFVELSKSGNEAIITTDLEAPINGVTGTTIDQTIILTNVHSTGAFVTADTLISLLRAGVIVVPPM